MTKSNHFQEEDDNGNGVATITAATTTAATTTTTINLHDYKKRRRPRPQDVVDDDCCKDNASNRRVLTSISKPSISRPSIVWWTTAPLMLLVVVTVSSTASAAAAAAATTTAYTTQATEPFQSSSLQHKLHSGWQQHSSAQHKRSNLKKSNRQLQTLQQCQIALAIGDTNRDDVLASAENEYVRFVNQLSGQQFSDVSSLADMPQPYQDSYANFADTAVGGIDVVGSKPGQTPTAAQEERLNDLCVETIAILNGEEVDEPGTSTEAPAPSSTLQEEPQPTLEDNVDDNNNDNDVDCTDTIPRTQCNTALSIADLSRDDLLNEEEYVRFVNRLSDNAYSDRTFDELPGNIKDNYDKFATASSSPSNEINVFGSKPGQTADETQDAFLNDLCCETDLAVQNPGAPTEPIVPPPTPVPQPSSDGPPTTDGGDGGDGDEDLDCSGTVERTQCNTAMSIADISRDDLMDPSEYVRFVNRLSNNEYSGSSFADLPGNIQSNFDKFAKTDGQVGIFGSKPGQRATPQQDEFLDDFCCQTDLAVQNPGAPTEPQPSQAPEPTEPTPTETFPPTFAETFCRTAMASSDFNRDDQLNDEEYVRFLNRLTSNEFAGQAFLDLDAALQDNFVSLAGADDQIDIFGSKPGQTANDEQEAVLDQICLDTAIALKGGGAPTAPRPTSPPVDGGPTFPPTFAETTCFSAMSSSDFNRDDFLNEEEFVRFLNRLTGNQYDGVAFDDLPPPLPETYNDLASGSDNGEIFIFGSKPGQTPTEEQEAFLEQICLDVAVALSQVEGVTTIAPATPTLSPGEPTAEITPAPTEAGGGPDPVPPTFPPGLSEVYNSFIVANTLGLTANDLQSGANREGLNTAYAEFAVRSVRQIGVVTENARRLIGNNSTTFELASSRLRGRRLVIELVADSTDIYLLVDSECPDSIQGTNTCQTAFAQFQLSITDEDPQTVSDEYTAATQVQIRNGLLQTTLDEVDPRNVLDVVNASFPVQTTLPPTQAPVTPTEAPATQPPSGGGEDGEGSSSTGAIVGGVLGGLVVIGICVYIYFKGVPFGMSAPSFKFGGRGGNKTDDEDDGDGGFDKDDDASAGDKDEFGGGVNAFGAKPKNSFGDDDDDDEKEDPKNVFGFRKKEKPESDNDRGFGFEEDYGMDSKGSGENSFADENGGGKYEFDEPSEVREDDDDDEKGSLNPNEDLFGSQPQSPGWGNAFGQNNDGWGAKNAVGNTSGEGDNFFGAQGFSEDKGEGSRSGSESDSYTTSEDSTYESDGRGDDDEDRGHENDDSYDDEDASGSFSRSSADDDRSGSYNSGSTPGSMASELRKKDEDMDAAIESGDWDAVAKAAGSFGKGQDSSIETSSKKESDGDISGDVDGDGDDYTDEDGSGSFSGSSRSGSMSGSGPDEGSASSATTTSEDLEKRAEYRAQVDALVRLVLPDETEKVDAMMEQFKGREAELVSTLQTMQERSANQRARAAVHKSKTRPQRSEGAEGAYAMGANGGAQGGEGAAAGTAAIAAASLPIPAAGMFGDDEEGEFGGEGGAFGGSGAFGEDPEYVDDEEESYHSGDGRSNSGSRSGSRSYYSDEEGSGPYSDEGSYSGEGSRSQSHYSGEDSRRDDSRRSEFSGEGSRSYYSGEESRRSGSRSQYSGEDSRRSGSRSHYSGEESGRSGFSGEGSRSQYSDEGSRSHYSGEEGSGPYSDEGSGSRSRSHTGSHSGSQSRSRSRRSGDEEGSGPYSDEGSRSYYSGEEEGSFTGSREGEDGGGSWGE